MDEIRDPNRGKAGVLPSRSSRPTRMQASRIEEVGNLGVAVIVKQLIDELHDRRRRLHLLRRGLPGIQRFKHLDPAQFEADMNPGGAFGRELEERRIFDDVREHALALAVRCGPIGPEAPAEVRRHQ